MKAWWTCLCLGATACAPPTGDTEVAAELRALRQVLVAGREAPARAPAVQVGEVARALAPMREALDELVRNQRELQQRQQLLTEEMQRWTALQLESGAGARGDELRAMASRLQQLEAALAAQAARQREVETLLRGALDRTAEHLDQFLLRVGADVDRAQATPAASTEPAAPAPAEPLQERASLGGRRGSVLAWWGMAGLATLIAGVLCWRRWRLVLAMSRPERRAPPRPEPTEGAADVQEIWAAAALLGEAVGRLRDAQPAGDQGGAAGAAEPSFPPGDEPIVLADDLPLPGVAPTPPPAGAAGGGAVAARRSEPAAITWRLRTGDPAGSMQAVLGLLQSDPRVLRRPEPIVRCSRDSLEVSFRCLPDLPAGERSHLEQRLRAACTAATP
ncbi:MAG: hypothetical protein KF830_13450 [Planctomycetes bacterium]|nr:hypothetical protein [Planctomycetota bacterium]